MNPPKIGTVAKVRALLIEADGLLGSVEVDEASGKINQALAMLDRFEEKPTIPDVLPEMVRFMREHPVGGKLHIVIDDGNFDDESMRYSLEHAIAEQDAAALSLAEKMIRMSITQRRRLVRRAEAEIHASKRREWERAMGGV